MADVTLMKTAAELGLAAEWQEAKSRLPGPAPLREAAFERFASTGLPHRRVEEWKYTDLRALMRDAKPLAARPDAKAFAALKDTSAGLGDLEARRIVIANGYLEPGWTDRNDPDPGITITSLFEWLTDDNLYRLRDMPDSARSDIAVS